MSDELELALQKPSGQSLHSWNPPPAYVPLTHFVQSVLVEPALPAKHPAQEIAPSAAVGQAMHVTALNAALKNPAAQTLQMVEPI
jgi:hypothetical protein